MSTPLVIGQDIGNAILKVYEGGRRKWDAPNVVDYRCDMKLVEGHEETADTWLDLEIIQSPAVTKATRMYFGELAVRRGGSSRPLVTNKLRDEHTSIAFVAGLARTAAHHLAKLKKAEREAYLGPNRDRYVVPVIVGTGCPITQFDSEEAPADKKLFGSRTKGSHLVRFVTTPDYKDLGKIEIVVERIYLYQEGVSVLADFRYDDSGALRRRGELDSYAAVIDPGANTLDWATIKPNGAVEPLLTSGRDLGLARAMDEFKDALNEKYGRYYTRAQLVSEVVNNDYTIPDGKGGRKNVWADAKPYLQSVADVVLEVVRKLHGDSHKQIGLFIFAGGGAAALKPFLEAEFKQPTYKAVEVEWLHDSIYGNAAGYQKRTLIKLAEERAKAGGTDA